MKKLKNEPQKIPRISIITLLVIILPLVKCKLDITPLYNNKVTLNNKWVDLFDFFEINGLMTDLEVVETESRSSMKNSF